jgi:hypothetical protein
MSNYILKDGLIIGKAYEVDARNYEVAIWDGTQFVGVSFDMDGPNMFSELHWDDAGTVKPLRELE